MENKKTQVAIAALLIIIGMVGIINQVFKINIFGHLSFGDLGVMALGLFFEWMYFSTKKSPGLLVPGGILTVVGFCDFVSALTGHLLLGHFPSGEIGVALGLFQLYWFGKRNKWLLVPVIILLVAALEEITEGMFKWLNSSLVWPIGLVVIGLVLLLNRKTDSSDKKQEL